MLRALGMKEKMKLGRRSRPMLVALARSKRLRGTVADPFRWAKVRQVERAMIPEYERAVRQVADRLTADNLDDAVAIAALPDQVRGYEELKLRRATAYRSEADRPPHRFLQLKRSLIAAESAAEEHQCGADDAGFVRQPGRDDLGARRRCSGNHFSGFRLTPPPTMIRSGENSLTTVCR